ncbi:MAG: Flp pilus assembly protein CpaB [Gammaproteobacteria bacterium]|nr:MAG: Flp pilus assembly protein CpaB [Gammaproteobacteria bacterium]
MLKRRGLFLVIVSLGMGGLAAWAANNWVQKRLGLTAETEVATEAVVIAALDIPYGTKVAGRHLKILAFPKGTAPPQAFREREDVQDMVATANILSGEILMRDRFAAHETGSTLAALVSKAMRAVTIRVDDVVGVAGFLLPGNRVDVLATRLDSRTRRATTETILKNLKVLAVDQTAATQDSDPVIVRAVTLEMTPAQTETLVKAKEEGTIQLTLRNPGERYELAEIPPPPAPAPRPVVRRAPRVAAPADVPITIIRGTNVERIRPQS